MENNLKEMANNKLSTEKPIEVPFLEGHRNDLCAIMESIDRNNDRILNKLKILRGEEVITENDSSKRTTPTGMCDTINMVSSDIDSGLRAMASMITELDKFI